jgi:WD40 repeat protein
MNRPVSVAYDALGRLVAHDAQGLRVWPAGSICAQMPPILQNPLPRLPGQGRVRTSMAKTPDGRIMALVRSSAIFLWRAETPDRIISVIPPLRYGAEPAPAASNGPERAPTTGANPSAPRFRNVQIAPRGDRLYLIDQIPSSPSSRLHAWALASAPEGPHVQARELGSSVPLPEGSFVNLAVRGDGAVLALGDRTGMVTLLDTASLRPLGRIEPASGEAEGFLLALAFSPDGRDLAVGSQQGTISLWSVAQPTRPRRRFHLPGHRGFITNLVFDSSGRRLASSAGLDPLVEVWDLELIGLELSRLELAD